MKKTIVIGAGPAGLAAADRLAKGGVDTMVLERDNCVGGISRTIKYKGYYYDIGGHRFFSRNEKVRAWWHGLLPHDFIKVARRSRIYYRGKFFSYPLNISNVVAEMGIPGSASILMSYMLSRLFKLRDEAGFEPWVVNRFGQRLYELFFRDYTRKVWGLDPNLLSADIAAMRIRGLSLSAALRNALSGGRNNTIKTLISEFYFPRLGSGMVYDAAAQRISGNGGRFMFNNSVVSVLHERDRIVAVKCRDNETGAVTELAASDFCSSMPLTSLVGSLEPAAPADVLDACGKLKYRSVIAVNCIVDNPDVCPDNWIYVHSPDVRVCRIQNFKNWSADMLADIRKSSLGMEYFCDENNGMWTRSDEQLLDLAAEELEKLGLCRKKEVIDGCVVRVAKTYPVYDRGYQEPLEAVRRFVKKFSNLHCMGRYGMFRYNGMDHSILTGLLAAENVMGENHDLWQATVETWDD